MAFLLRSISRSADGREIVRTSRVDDDLLKIGRDPDCDIRLNDLAVALHHATIEQVSATKVGVSAEAGLTVEIDGINTQFGQIDVGIGGAVKVGPFLLRILPPEFGSEDVPIDIQRADTDAEDDRFDTRRFALQTVMPGKRAMAWTLTLLVLAIFLVWPIISFYQNRDRRTAWRWASTPIRCGAAAICPARTPRSAPIARPATSARSSRCRIRPANPATPTSTTMPRWR